MSELGQALETIFEKLAAFFDIFDLSFFVSGAIALGAIVFGLHSNKIPEPQVEGWIKVSILILGSYASGLICFAAARFIRLTLCPAVVDAGAQLVHHESAEGKSHSIQNVRRSFMRRAVTERRLEVLKGHGLFESKAIQDYLQRSDGDWRLYIRFWAELRNASEMAGTLNFLNRYWVMAATYDGVGFALIVWFIVLAHCLLILDNPLKPYPTVALVIILAVALMSAACFKEASRYTKYQFEELVAAIAANRARADVE